MRVPDNFHDCNFALQASLETFRGDLGLVYNFYSTVLVRLNVDCVLDLRPTAVHVRGWSLKSRHARGREV